MNPTVASVRKRTLLTPSTAVLKRMRGNIDPWTHSSSSENLHFFVHSRHRAAGENISKFKIRCGDPPTIPPNSKMFITVTDAAIPNVPTNFKNKEDYVLVDLKTDQGNNFYMRIDFATDFYTVDGLINWWNDCILKSMSYGAGLGNPYAEIFDNLNNAKMGTPVAGSIPNQVISHYKMLTLEKQNDVLYFRPRVNSFTPTAPPGQTVEKVDNSYLWIYFSNEKTASRFGYFEQDPMTNPYKLTHPYTVSHDPTNVTTSDLWYYDNYDFPKPPVLLPHNSVQIRANLSFTNSYETYDSIDYHVNTTKSNILASFPINGAYGDLLAYDDRMTPIEVSGKMTLDVIELELTDEDGDLLDLDAEWSCCLTISFRPSPTGAI